DLPRQLLKRRLLGLVIRGLEQVGPALGDDAVGPPRLGPAVERLADSPHRIPRRVDEREDRQANVPGQREPGPDHSAEVVRRPPARLGGQAEDKQPLFDFHNLLWSNVLTFAGIHPHTVEVTGSNPVAPIAETRSPRPAGASSSAQESWRTAQ